MTPPQYTAGAGADVRGLGVVLDGGRVPMHRRMTRAAAVTFSALVAPPVAIAVAMGLAATAGGHPHAWALAGFYVLVSIVTPVLVLLGQLRRREVGDIELTSRTDRFVPQLVMLGSLIAGWVLLELSSAPPRMTLLAAALAIQGAAILLVTLRWKISVHCAAAAVVGTLLSVLADSPFPAVVVIIAMAWSRLYLHHHTLAQTAAGTVLGVAVSVGAWLLSGGV